MQKNKYIAMRDADRQAFMTAGMQTGRQQIIDMMCLVLNDPEIMGKDTFGPTRLLKVINGIGTYMDKFELAYGVGNEADYYQDQMDQLLGKALGCKMEFTFPKRYEYIKQFDYTGKKGAHHG